MSKDEQWDIGETPLLLILALAAICGSNETSKNKQHDIGETPLLRILALAA